MENKNDMLGMLEQLDRDKKKYLKFVVLFVCILIALSVVWSRFDQSEQPAGGGTVDTSAEDPDKHFKDCTLLAEKCIDVVECELNVYCGDGAFKDCRVYDCSEKYGVYTLDLSDTVKFSEAAKPDTSAIVAAEEACGGTMEIISQECNEEKKMMETKMRLVTKGECRIETIATIYEEDGGAHANTFTLLPDGTYSIISEGCGKISRITPANEYGTGLVFAQAGAESSLNE